MLDGLPKTSLGGPFAENIIVRRITLLLRRYWLLYQRHLRYVLV